MTTITVKALACSLLSLQLAACGDTKSQLQTEPKQQSQQTTVATSKNSSLDIQINPKAQQGFVDPQEDLGKLPALDIAYNINHHRFFVDEPNATWYELIIKNVDGEYKELINKAVDETQEGEHGCALSSFGGMDSDPQYAKKSFKYHVKDNQIATQFFGDEESFKSKSNPSSITFVFDDVKSTNPKITDILFQDLSDKQFTKDCLSGKFSFY